MTGLGLRVLTSGRCDTRLEHLADTVAAPVTSARCYLPIQLAGFAQGEASEVPPNPVVIILLFTSESQRRQAKEISGEWQGSYNLSISSSLAWRWA
jgi:hypothetical protein